MTPVKASSVGKSISHGVTTLPLIYRSITTQNCTKKTENKSRANAHTSRLQA